MKVILIPGNGGGGPNDNWFPYLKTELEKLKIQLIASEFPDSFLAREAYWIPFLQDVLKADKETVLVGYSSGAIAAMRFAETHPILGSVLVSGYYTDLGNRFEKESGYFNRPWDWEAIRKHQKWTIQFSSTDDPWIPIEEARFVHEKLQTEYHEFHDQGHFGGPQPKAIFPELVEALQQKIK